MSSKILLALLLVITCLWSVESSNILMVWSMPAHSHYTLGISLAQGLAEKGHQITFVSPYAQKKPHKNIKDIVVEDPIPFVDELKKQLFEFDKNSFITNMKSFLSMSEEITRLFLQSEKVQTFLKSKQHFDLFIMEPFVNEAVMGFGYYFKVPTVLVASMDATMYGNLLGNPAPSSYIANAGGEFTSDMNFWQRLANFLGGNFMSAFKEIIINKAQRELFKKYITSEIELDDVMYNASIMLTNSHVSIGHAQPLVPNIIDVGGFHVRPSQKLPEDVQKFLDDAKDGVILFSMGSNLKSADLKPEVHEALVKSFSKIKQKVLWKFEKELPGLSPNVKIMKWLPQSDILAHPNVRAFISHGGLLGTIETISSGVPVIGIPVFGDQKSNIATAVANGYAISVPLSEITEEKMSHALNEIINNPKYRENAKLRSKVWHDRPQSPMETAIYWVEYVIRHQGAPILRSAALKLCWYQVYMIDIILFLTLVTIVLFAIFYIIIRWLLGLVCGKKDSQTSGSESKSSKKKSKRE